MAGIGLGGNSGTDELQNYLEIEWTTVRYDASRHFRVSGNVASCQLEAQVEVPSRDSRGSPIQSKPPNLTLPSSEMR